MNPAWASASQRQLPTSRRARGGGISTPIAQAAMPAFDLSFPCELDQVGAQVGHGQALPGVPGTGRAWLLEFRERESDFQPPDLKEQQWAHRSWTALSAHHAGAGCGGPRAQPGGSGVVFTAPENFLGPELYHPGAG